VSLTVREITPEQHRAYIRTRPSVSFLQVPAWGEVKSDWGHYSLGWFDGDRIVGACLVLTRKVPKLPRFLAYVPEGPDIDWSGVRSAEMLHEWLDPFLSELKSRGCFAVKIGPPVPIRRWRADTVKRAVGSGQAARLGDIEPDWQDGAAVAVLESLRALGWRQEEQQGAGFGDIQPRYVFQLALAGKSDDELLAGFNQLWRRNIRKAAKAGVEVVRGDRGDLAEFHSLYVETAQRDGFLPRPLPYFQGMWDAFAAEDSAAMEVYLARHDGKVLAATTAMTVGDHCWYSYGASSGEGREVRPSNAIQWRMITDARDAGASVYDLRGITDTLDSKDPLFGLIQFKLGTGGYAQEYVGEWDYALRPAMSWAFDQYMARRGQG
jgi:lipid II:glycine glycyltransferase (peptidoglycan interpeptide bridge formation enzyme)